MHSAILVAAMCCFSLPVAVLRTGGTVQTPAGQAQSKPSSRPSSQSSSQSSSKPAATTGTMAEAKELLQKLLDPATDRLALTESLRPTSDDYKALFVAEAAAKAEAEYDKVWAKVSHEAAIGPKEGQTELKVSSATTEDLRAWNEAAQQFPGGYKEVANQLAPGIHWYRFRFVKPGEEAGMAFDGLVFVHGHWVFVPRPWRALR